MKKSTPILGLALGAILVPAITFAADHIDSPSAVGEPAADITDLFAWMSDDASKVNLVLIANLGSQSHALERQVQIDPTNLPAREQLVGLLMARTQYLGTMDDFDTAFAVVDDALARNLAPARMAALHAQLLSSVHRFDQALAELDRAESLGAQNLEALRQTIALAKEEDVAGIIDDRQAIAMANSSYGSQTRLAAALGAGDRFADSDDAFADALEAYRDVSPFPIAWVSFQRGVMWGEAAGDRDRAFLLYQDAVATLPQYVVGNVHLAELEVERGRPDLAIARLETIVDTTVDPEPASRLAQFLEASDPERASLYTERAREGYEYYLSKYPLAFADHAAEFYLGAGRDAERALELALLNLGNRKTRRAYALAIGAAAAAEQWGLACELAEQGQVSEAPSGC